jgi:hypothetical protein
VATWRHGVRKQKKRLLIFGAQAREQEALGIKSTNTNAQKDVVRSFVSHNGGIILQIDQL